MICWEKRAWIGSLRRVTYSELSLSVWRYLLAPPHAGVPVTRGVRQAPLRSQHHFRAQALRDVRRRAGKWCLIEGRANRGGPGVRPLLYRTSEPPDGDCVPGATGFCSSKPAIQSQPRSRHDRRTKSPALVVTPDSALAHIMPEGPLDLLHLKNWTSKLLPLRAVVNIFLKDASKTVNMRNNQNYLCLNRYQVLF